MFDVEHARHGDLADVRDAVRAEMHLPVFDVDALVREKRGDRFENAGPVAAGHREHVAFAVYRRAGGAIRVVGYDDDGGLMGAEIGLDGVAHAVRGHERGEGGREDDREVALDDGLADAVDIGAQVGHGGGDVAQNGHAIGHQHGYHVSVVSGAIHHHAKTG